MQASPATFLHAIAPYRADFVVCVACLFPWDGLAARCARASRPLVLGQALSMQAIPGGKTHTDRLERIFPSKPKR